MSPASSDPLPLWFWPATIALACVAACCDHDELLPDAGPDGGADAGRQDGGSDAGARDSGPRDAGSDGGRVEPVWVPLSGLPDGCEISMAQDPEAAVGRLAFEPCPDLEGCRQLVVDWMSREAPRFQLTSSGPILEVPDLSGEPPVEGYDPDEDERSR